MGSCKPSTCADQHVECGPAGDGCGGILPECGKCGAGLRCGGPNAPSKCVSPLVGTGCVPKTCAELGLECGLGGDGCGGAANQTCGGGGSPNTCGSASCTPKTCSQQGAQCGAVSDQCGGIATCGPCPNAGDFCNGQNLCIGTTCSPKSCVELNVQCGPTADTCGGLVDCGGCPLGQGCGAGGTPGQCGKQPCTPRTCSDLGAVCGQVADGCGGITPDCGSCTTSQSCKNGACIVACTPATCAALGANCGSVADGCGGLLNCGVCAAGQECGFNNKANVCGGDVPK